MSADQFLIHCMDCEFCRETAAAFVEGKEPAFPYQLCAEGRALLVGEIIDDMNKRPKDDNAQIQITE